MYLRGGTFAERIDSNSRTIPVGSSWSSPVTIASYPGETATIRYGAGVLNLAASYIQYLIFDRIVFDAANAGSCPPNDGCGVAVISIWGGAHHIRIQNSDIRNSVGQGITIFPGNGLSSDYNELVGNRIHDNGVSDFDHGVYLSTNNTLIDGNEIYNNAGWGIHKYPSGNNNIIRNNRVHHNAKLGKRGDGIYLQGGSGNLVYNNIVWANDTGIGTNRETNARIYNNTTTGNRSYGVSVVSDTNTSIQNNILHNNGAGHFAPYNSSTYTISRNLCGSPGTGCLVVADPKFVNASGNDFRVLSGSPVIDVGATLTIVTNDADGKARPSGAAYDIGAYEFASGSATLPAPAAPTNLRITH